MKKTIRLLEQGVGDNKFFLDDSGNRVVVNFIDTKVYRREDVSLPWSQVGEKIPKSANAHFLRRVEKTERGVYFYTFEYYRILK